MAYSKTLICNMAVAHCGGAGRISDVDLDTSNEARNCRLFYDTVIHNLLAMQRWGWASQEIPLVRIDNPGAAWQYRYMYPNLIARANFIVDSAVRVPREDQKLPYRIVNIPSADGYGKAIDTDQADAVLDANMLIEDPTLFTPAFGLTASLMLATMISVPMRIDPAIVSRVEASFQFWLAESAKQNLAEETEDQEPDSEFQSVRT